MGIAHTSLLRKAGFICCWFCVFAAAVAASVQRFRWTYLGRNPSVLPIRRGSINKNKHTKTILQKNPQTQVNKHIQTNTTFLSSKWAGAWPLGVCGGVLHPPTFRFSANLQYVNSASRRCLTNETLGKSSLSANLSREKCSLLVNWAYHISNNLP